MGGQSTGKGRIVVCSNAAVPVALGSPPLGVNFLNGPGPEHHLAGAAPGEYLIKPRFQGAVEGQGLGGRNR